MMMDTKGNKDEYLKSFLSRATKFYFVQWPKKFHPFIYSFFFFQTAKNRRKYMSGCLLAGG